MRLRAWHLGGALLAVLLLWLGGRVYLVERGPIVRFTEAQSNQIREGMTQVEVEQVLGMGPGDYRSRFAQHNSDPLMQTSSDEDSYTREWVSDEGLIAVDFTREGKVKCALFGTVAPARMTLFERIQMVLGL